MKKAIPIELNNGGTYIIEIPESASDNPIKGKDAIILELYEKLKNSYSIDDMRTCWIGARNTKTDNFNIFMKKYYNKDIE